MSKIKRINVEYGGGADTVLFSVKENRFFSYEEDRDELHRRYGGEQYYNSLTGLSGAGYFEPVPKEDDLVEFGFYRTDARSEQMIKVVHKVQQNPIFGYAPISNHGGITEGRPFVLTDGKRVAFVSQWKMKETLLNWENIEGKKIKFSWFDSCENERRGEFELYNPQHMGGVRATRFIDLREARSEKEELLQKREEIGGGYSLFEDKLSIFTGRRGMWFHISFEGIFDMRWNKDPHNIEGEVVDGWVGAGNGLYWRRRRDDIEAFMEVRRGGLVEGKYVVEGETAELIHYEQDFSVLEWFSEDVESWKKHFVSKLTRKARKDYIFVLQRSGVDIRRLMEQIPEAMVCIQDSLDCGNCRTGTKEFMKKYGIEPDEEECISMKKLLENKSIDEMLKNFAFQKVIHNKLDKLVDSNKEMPLFEEEVVQEENQS